jgi:hypothetical protein
MGATVFSATIVKLSARTMDHYDNNLDLCLRKPTNFSIDHILSTKHSRRKDGNRPPSMALNKVPPNPWSSRGPLSFDPSLCKNQKNNVINIQRISNHNLQCYSPETTFSAIKHTSTATSTSSNPNATNCQLDFYQKSEPISYNVIPKISEINNNNNVITINNHVNCFCNPPNYGQCDSVEQQTNLYHFDDKRPILLIGDSLIHKCEICEKIFSSSETLNVSIFGIFFSLSLFFIFSIL